MTDPSSRSRPARASPADQLRLGVGGSQTRPDRSVRPMAQDAGLFETLADPTSLRAWQRLALERLAGWQEGPFLISAAPGAGKTRPALELAKRLLAQRAVSRIAVLCPTTPLTRQWASAAAALGVQLAPDAAGPRPPRDFAGVAVTYARVASDPRGWAQKVTPDTLVILDEAHHLGEDLAWGTGFQQAFAAAPRRLLLSGTPFRSDATPIPGVRYDAERLAIPDVSYTYAEAVADGICRPVTFVTFDGTLSWRSGEDRDRVLLRDRPQRARGEPPLPHRDLDRAARRAAPDPARGRREAARAARRGPSRRGRARSCRRRDPCAADRQAAHRGDRAGTGGRAAHRGARFAEAGRLPRFARAVDRGSEHGLRGRRHPTPARRRLRDCGEDSADLPPDRRALRAHDHRPGAGAELAVPAGGAGPLRPRERDRTRAAPRAARPGSRGGSGSAA